MPRHPPCALKNLTTKIKNISRENHRNQPHPNTQRASTAQPDPGSLILEIASYTRCSRPLCSSQTTTPHHTPHTQSARRTSWQGNQKQSTTSQKPMVLLPQDPTVCQTLNHPAPHPPFQNHHWSVLDTKRTTRPLFVDIPPMSTRRRTIACATGLLPDNTTTSMRRQWTLEVLLRKEVIQPHLPVRLPCYDLVPIASPTFDSSLPQGVRPPASGVTNFRDLTGGVYKARERIHRSVADLRLLATPTSWGRVADPNPN